MHFIVFNAWGQQRSEFSISIIGLRYAPVAGAHIYTSYGSQLQTAPGLLLHFTASEKNRLYWVLIFTKRMLEHRAAYPVIDLNPEELRFSQDWNIFLIKKERFISVHRPWFFMNILELGDFSNKTIHLYIGWITQERTLDWAGVSS